MDMIWVWDNRQSIDTYIGMHLCYWIQVKRELRLIEEKHSSTPNPYYSHIPEGTLVSHDEYACKKKERWLVSSGRKSGQLALTLSQVVSKPFPLHHYILFFVWLNKMLGQHLLNFDILESHI